MNTQIHTKQIWGFVGLPRIKATGFFFQILNYNAFLQVSQEQLTKSQQIPMEFMGVHGVKFFRVLSIYYLFIVIFLNGQNSTNSSESIILCSTYVPAVYAEKNIILWNLLILNILKLWDIAEVVLEVTPAVVWWSLLIWTTAPEIHIRCL